MGHLHHVHDHPLELHDDLTSERTERRLWIAVAVCAFVTLIALIALWPRGSVPSTLDTSDLFGSRVAAVVTGTDVQPCSYDPLLDCREVTIQIASGDNKRTTSTWEVDFTNTTRPYQTGDEIYVYETRLADGTLSYQFADYRRDTPMLLLALIFAVAVIVLGRWKGVGAIGGLIASLLVIVYFLLPSLLRGHDAVAVALVASSVIAFIALYLAHG